MSLKWSGFSVETERFTTYGAKIGADKGHFISSC